jgi:hypothetical protein
MTLPLAALAAVLVLFFLATPSGRAQVLLDFGGLRVNQALALEQQAPSRAATLASAEATLTLALTQDAGHPALLRELARVRSARFDDAGALDALRRAAESPRLDAFDMLQIGHLYRDFGFAEDGYKWAARAYAIWDRNPEDAVMQVYAQRTLVDDFRAQTLADQAEAAMRARSFSEARQLFEQALTFKPGSAYLQDRVGAAARAIEKYGSGTR